MYLPDVNICLAAFRTDHTNHLESRQWLRTVYVNEARVGMSPQVLCAVVRITTNPAFMGGNPSSLGDALTFSQALIDHPNTVLVGATREQWVEFCKACRASGAKGNLVSDAWFAAIAIEHGCTWVTNDTDFAKFPGLKWQKPQL